MDKRMRLPGSVSMRPQTGPASRCLTTDCALASSDPRRLRSIALMQRAEEPAFAREIMHRAVDAAALNQAALVDFSYAAVDDWARWALQDRSSDLAEAVTRRFAIHPCPATACAVADVARLVGSVVGEAFGRTISVLEPADRVLCQIAVGDLPSALVELAGSTTATIREHYRLEAQPTAQALEMAEWAGFTVRQNATENLFSGETVFALAGVIDECGLILEAPHDPWACVAERSAERRSLTS